MRFRRLCTFCLAAVLAGCANPAARFEREAARHGFSERIDSAGAYRHVVYSKGQARADKPLTIYLDGDGDPTAGQAGRDDDPTTRERLILRLMAADPNPAVLVGRPCYYGTAADAACDPSLWTTRRYAPEVIADMAAAVNRMLNALPHAAVTLVGYSGGGAIAMLVAPRLSRIDRLITIAANLDIEAWARHHGHAAPALSLNPAASPPLAADVVQRHFYGAEDRNVPAATAQAVIARQHKAELRVIAGYDHRCCWAEGWANILAGGLP